MSLLKQGNAAFKNKDYQKAIEIYKSIIAEKPELRGVVQFNLNYAESKLLVTKKTKNQSVGVVSKLKKITDSVLNSVSKNKIVQNECVLKFDNVSNNFAQGWAMDLVEKNQPVVLEVLINQIPYSIIETSVMRKDVQKAHGGDGFFGYRAELNPYFTFSNDTQVHIKPLSHRLDENSNNSINKNASSMLKGVHFKEVNEKAKDSVNSYLRLPKIESNRKFNVSIIILNLNGETVLKECINSILKHNSYAEIIVVDHASTDGSIELLKSFNSSRIKIILRDKNYSYSDSNNLGAKEASGEILIFLNNDIVLTSDTVSHMSEVISQDEFGLLGVKLWDLPKSNGFKLAEDVKVSQHLGVHFKGLKRNETIEAFEVRSPAFIDLNVGVLETPAVTAAMLAIYKNEFFEIEGFNDKYFYGQEDVDFCLRYYRHFKKKTGVLLDDGAYHIRGLSRRTLSVHNKSYIGDNRKIIQEELGSWFRKEFRKGQFYRPGFWNQKPFTIAMIVSEISFETDKADFFTAKELGDTFESSPNTAVGYFDVNSDYDVTGYDAVIVYIDGFDPRRLKNLSPHTIVIGWARNWFDRWCDRVWVEHYDYIYASSEFARQYMQSRLKREVGLLRIAASNDCIAKMEANSGYQSDYVFTGSYFNSPREITELLQPEKIPFEFKLFGHNWEGHEKFKKYTQGSVSYKDIPTVYASTKLVVDDANIATKKWGSINCRVFDSIAMGVPCITNNLLGVGEIFDSEFPTYQDSKLNQTIEGLLGDDKKRLQIAERYKNIVLQEHTYLNRCKSIVEDIKRIVCKQTIAIKIAAPDFERGVSWGDYYFAVELRNELEKLDYKVRIDCMDQWYGDRTLNDDVNIVLRGLDRFKGRKDQVNLLWIISHPDMVCEEELKDFDHVFVASEFFTKKLKDFTGMDSISFLPQASAFDASKLNPEILVDTPEHEILFVGNSRNEYRQVVKWCVEADLPIAVYGKGWEQFIPEKYIKGEFIDNQLLPYFYNKAGVVLNDHWKDMREKGFVSNRVYDVTFVNGCIITDYVEGMPENQNIHTFSNKKEFISKVQSVKKIDKHTPLSNSFNTLASKIRSVL